MIKKNLIIILALFLLIPKTYAYVNYETSYNITIPELNVFNSTVGEGTFKDFVDSIKAIETSKYYDITINLSYSNNIFNITAFSIYIYNSTPLFSSRIYYNNNRRYFYMHRAFSFSDTYYWTSWSNLNNPTTIYNTINNCLTNNDCSALYQNNTDYNGYQQLNTNFPSNNVSSDLTLPYENQYAMSNFLVYSNFNHIYEQPVTDTESSNFYKKVYINNTELIDGGYLPTYYDLYYPDTPEPEPEPGPDEPDEPSEHNFTNWIYWFDEPTDSISVLNNIYTLLFLYCITIIIFKTYSFIKPKKY